MVNRVTVSLSVRKFRLVKWLAPVLILATFAGCGHRRSAMRPVYGTPMPATTVPSCPTPLPGGTMTTEPDSSEPFLTPAGVNPSAIGSGPVIRAGGSPPVPNSADEMEPSLTVPGTVPPVSPRPTSGSGSGPIDLNGPTAVRGTGKAASLPGGPAELHSANRSLPIWLTRTTCSSLPRRIDPGNMSFCTIARLPKVASTRLTANIARFLALKDADIIS